MKYIETPDNDTYYWSYIHYNMENEELDACARHTKLSDSELLNVRFPTYAELQEAYDDITIADRKSRFVPSFDSDGEWKKALKWALENYDTIMEKHEREEERW